MSTGGVEVLKPGLDTCVQDFPGRLGHAARGFPRSGPLDSWSFRIGNRLVGNPAGTAALECQYAGPTLRFLQDTIVSICGADMSPTLQGERVALWQTIRVKMGDCLQLQFARLGVRSYIAVAGGLDVPLFLGSGSTFAKAGVGGHEGRRLVVGDRVGFGRESLAAERATWPAHLRPQIVAGGEWTIEVVAGPHDDWIAPASLQQFLDHGWVLSSKSDRTGLRLEGPAWNFSHLAIDKPPEHGAEPSNIIDYGYPVGGVNLGGQTPIILVNDALNMGGFICPFTVPTCAFWKLAQAKPGDRLHFQLIDVEHAHALRREQDATLDAAP